MTGGWTMAVLVGVAAAGCVAPRGSAVRAAARDRAGLVQLEPPCPGQRRGVVRWEGGGIGVDACGVVRRYGPETPGASRGADEWIEEMNAAIGR